MKPENYRPLSSVTHLDICHRGLWFRIMLLHYLLLLHVVLPAQKSDYVLPLPFPLHLSGTFAEFRYDHLHSGIDIPAVMNSPVYSIADGFVSRIRLQPSGFGKVMYIDHPNGYTSVYAHLNNFNPELEKYFIEKQYEFNTYDLDYYPQKGELRVKKGQVIAYSGNSGASQGPHLHFEIRETISENPTNPLLCGIPVHDPVRPFFKILRIYAADVRGHILPGRSPADIRVVRTKSGFQLKTPGVVKVPPLVQFGIQANDIDVSGNRNGLYSVDVFLDSVLHYSSGMDYFSFKQFRSVNSLIDYPLYLKTRRFVQVTRVAACNELAIFKNQETRNVFNFSDCKKHKVLLVISDIQGNKATLGFEAICEGPLTDLPSIPLSDKVVERLPCGKDQDFQRRDIKIYFPKGVLFDTLDFEYQRSVAEGRQYSAIHHIHNVNTPLNDNFILSIMADNLPEALQEKACIARTNGAGAKSYAGGGFQNGWVTTMSRKFGTFCVWIDDTPPVITQVIKYKKRKGKKIRVTPATELKFRCSDNFSGIGSYCGYLNGEWVIVEYNPRGNILQFRWDGRLIPGINKVELVVADKKGNETRWQGEIRK